MERIRIGDNVKWTGAPNELSVGRYGTVVKIHKSIAHVDSNYPYNHIKLVPVKSLIKY